MAHRLTSAATVALLVAACGGAQKPANEDDLRITSVEVAELEITDVGTDRFTSCPPPGELGQKWIPPIPAWTAAASPDGAASASSMPPGEAVEERGRAEQAIASTRSEFRRCWHRGLFHDPTQDGRVAFALRVAPDGKVAKVEAYGACDLSSEVLTCMRQAASELRFRASGKADTVVVPVVLAGSRVRRTAPIANEAYTADAFVALEAARPALHGCAQRAQKEDKAVFASATFGLDVDVEGKVSHAHVENWSGDQEVLTCVAEALTAVTFPAPPTKRAHVRTRVTLNPRPGSR